MKNTLPLISIIVPVYKVEKYLKRCVDSICQQTYQNLQIILIDDGSPDQCGVMCDRFASEDYRIRVMHKENGGLSSARNCALNVAKGAYIGFVDSDDYIDKEMYEKLYSLMQSFQAQISCCSIRNVNEEGKTIFTDNNESQGVMVYSKKDALMELLNNRIITNSFCDKLFCSTIFNEIRFVEGMILEDMEAMPRCLSKANRVVYTAESYYNYVMTPNSILRSDFSIRQFDSMRASTQRVMFFEQECPEGLNRAKAQHISICLDLIYRSYNIPECNSKREEAVKEVFRLWAEIGSRGMRRKTLIKGMLLKCGLPIYFAVMKVYYFLTSSRIKHKSRQKVQ